VADSTANPKFVASDLLSQAEHGADSMVVLVAIGLSKWELEAIETEVERQASRLPRGNIVVMALANSYIIQFDTLQKAMEFTNEYAPEHLILYTSESSKALDLVQNAGSVFVGAWSPVSCGDYASGTNHVYSPAFLSNRRLCQRMDMRKCIVVSTHRAFRNILRVKN
jgi:phosphoribosyl-ATP pyrophosphohydrolase / phosphoribosyl-AMP cyclohydrolase / histidinol dehydrogenase